MSLMDRLRDAFTPIVPERALTVEKVFGTGADETWWATMSSAGEPVTSESVMRAAAGACVRLLADDISTLPVDVYRKVGEESVPIDRPEWVERPTGRYFDDISALMSDIVVSLGTNGVAFLYGLPTIFRPEYIEALDPDKTTVEQDRDTGRRLWRNYEVQGAPLDESHVAQIDWVRRPGGLAGLSPLEAAKDSTGIELAAQQWAGAYFANGAQLGGIVQVPGGPETVNADGLRQQFEARHAGKDNWWKPGVLTGGAEYKNTTISPKEADLGPLFARVLEEAARIYHIPPHLLGSQMAGAVSYASVEQRSIEYVQHAVVPFTTRIERVLSRLVPGDDTFLKLNVNALLRGDAQARSEYYRTMAELKVMKPKTIARLEDLPPDEAVDGFHESPNNNGRPEAQAPTDDDRALSIDTVTIGDDSAERIADTARSGAAVATAEVQRTGDRLIEHFDARIRAIEDAERQKAEEMAAIRELLADRNAPPDISIDGDTVYYRRGNEVIKKHVQRDERGKVIGMVAA